MSSGDEMPLSCRICGLEVLGDGGTCLACIDRVDQERLKVRRDAEERGYARGRKAERDDVWSFLHARAERMRVEGYHGAGAEGRYGAHVATAADIDAGLHVDASAKRAQQPKSGAPQPREIWRLGREYHEERIERCRGLLRQGMSAPKDEPIKTVSEGIAKVRANYIGAPAFYNLNQACAIVARAFGQSVYLVGSAIDRRDFRDVDVRLLLEDDEFAALFTSTGGGALDARWSMLCASISLWLSQQSGLPVDFQIQQATRANIEHAGPRHALGIFLNYPGDVPGLDKAAPKP